MEPRLEKAKNGKRKIYFVDAAHFVLGGFLGCLWCFVRLYLPTPAGRQRYNVLGAIDAITHQLITECNEVYINARYQHCKLVQNYAKELNIELLFLPSYSPNLNIIERLWKWVKKDCLYCKYYEKFDAF